MTTMLFELNEMFTRPAGPIMFGFVSCMGQAVTVLYDPNLEATQ